MEVILIVLFVVSIVLQSAFRTLLSDHHLKIIVLGETGAGKSSFINAFSVLCQFPNLQDAINHAENYQWPIQIQETVSFHNECGAFEKLKISSDIVDANEGGCSKVDIGKRDDIVENSFKAKTISPIEHEFTGPNNIFRYH